MSPNKISHLLKMFNQMLRLEKTNNNNIMMSLENKLNKKNKRKNRQNLLFNARKDNFKPKC
jgi:hypothetical protein